MRQFQQLALSSMPPIGVRGHLELRHSVGHCLAAGLIDVPRIDACGVHLRDAPGQGVLADALGENLAAFSGELLGVVQPHDAAPWVENYRRGEYRTKREPRPASSKPAIRCQPLCRAMRSNREEQSRRIGAIMA